MPRKPNPHSRTAPVTAREMKLEEQVRRLRAELAMLHQQQECGLKTAQGLSPEERLDLIEKIGRMFRNGALHRVSEGERCSVCGGMTEEQIQAGWMRWAQEAADGVARAAAWRADRGR